MFSELPPGESHPVGFGVMTAPDAVGVILRPVSDSARSQP